MIDIWRGLWRTFKFLRLEVIKVNLAIVGNIGGIAALILSLRKRLQEERKECDDQKSRDHDWFVNGFREAALLQGNEDPSIQLAGMYAMTNLAKQHPAQAQQCVDVMCAKLRLLPQKPPYNHPDVQVR